MHCPSQARRHVTNYQAMIFWRGIPKIAFGNSMGEAVQNVGGDAGDVVVVVVVGKGAAPGNRGHREDGAAADDDAAGDGTRLDVERDAIADRDAIDLDPGEGLDRAAAVDAGVAAKLRAAEQLQRAAAVRARRAIAPRATTNTSAIPGIPFRTRKRSRSTIRAIS